MWARSSASSRSASLSPAVAARRVCHWWGVTDVAMSGFSLVPWHTVAWEHPSAAEGALLCPATRLVPEMVLGRFRELGSSSVLKANKA